MKSTVCGTISRKADPNQRIGGTVGGTKSAPLSDLDWRRRARALGLKQRTIAAILGACESTVSNWLAGKSRMPAAVSAIILAWEIMAPPQRADFLFRAQPRLLGRQRIVTRHEDETARLRATAA
jgi:hypothetical protein